MSDSLFESQAATASKLGQTTAAQRRARLEKLLGAILDRRDAIVEAAQRDFGRHPDETHLIEMLPLVGEIKHALRNLERWIKPRRIRPTLAALATLGSTSRVVYQPKGRCLIISPWNHPLGLALGPMVSAVAAGNTVILKPSEFTPHTNRIVKQIVAMVFPPDEVAVVTGAADTAAALLALPFDHIFFAGSPAAGQRVMAAAASHRASVTLELGGKSPVIVDAGANLRDAAEYIIRAKTLNAGQSCVAPDHAYVHREVVERFVELCRGAIARRFGESDAAIRANPGYPRLIHRRHTIRVVSLVLDAVAAGGRLVCGGAFDSEMRYVAPTLLLDVPSKAQIRGEEILGPVLPILTFDSLDTVIAEINAASEPPALYAWTKDARTVEALKTRTHSGSLCVNLALGGVNSSGLGTVRGFHGFKAFSRERAMMSAGPLSALKWLFESHDLRGP
jgi:aldehyde dehydrogenase (NAD+)